MAPSALPTSPSLLDQARPLFETPPPVLDEQDAVRIAEEAYGITGQAKRLSGERDTNFVIQTIDAPAGAVVLKAINSTEPDDEADMQGQVLEYLRGHAGPLSVPAPVLSREGLGVHRAVTRAGLAVRTRCYTYLPGEPTQSRPVDDTLRRSIGRTAARVVQALAGFCHPAADRLNLWDLCKIGHLVPLIEGVPASPLRDRCARFLDHFSTVVEPRLPTLRQQVIHNDLSRSNTLTDPDSPDGLLKVVDFGDMITAPVLSELAVAASYQIAGSDPLRNLQTVVDAFEDVLPLLSEERSLLLDFVLARLMGRILITRWRASQFPENQAYILRSSEEAAALLAVLYPVWQETVPVHHRLPSERPFL